MEEENMDKKFVLAALLLFVFFCPSVKSEEPSPELPVVQWKQGNISLEDFKGQTTALVFFTDSFY